jgi:hypothetical protein
MDVFKFAFNSALFDVDRAWDGYYRIAWICMPLEHPETKQVLPWELPSDDALRSMYAASGRFSETFDTLNSYIFDLQVEMQNRLLGELFQNTVPKRRPIDPRLKVITLEDSDGLKTFFEQSTPWGAMQRESNARAAAIVRDREER